LAWDGVSSPGSIELLDRAGASSRPRSFATVDGAMPSCGEVGLRDAGVDDGSHRPGPIERGQVLAVEVLDELLDRELGGRSLDVVDDRRDLGQAGLREARSRRWPQTRRSRRRRRRGGP
jgi:hypothetical protein